jgi:hypothetical protein
MLMNKMVGIEVYWLFVMFLGFGDSWVEFYGCWLLILVGGNFWSSFFNKQKL